MSSGSQRDKPNGLIRQGTRVVGCISLPDASEVFIQEFNHCYGQLRMQVEEPSPTLVVAPSNPYTFRLPTWFRHVWHSKDQLEDSQS